jgi:hypothetical protein
LIIISFYDYQNPIFEWRGTVQSSYLPKKFTVLRPTNVILDVTSIVFINKDSNNNYNFIIGFFSNSASNSLLYINKNSIFNALYINNSLFFSGNGYPNGAFSNFINIPLGGQSPQTGPISQYQISYKASYNTHITILSIPQQQLAGLSQTIYDGSTGLPKSNTGGLPAAPGDWIYLQ